MAQVRFKWLFGILISFGAVFLMSHNSYATNDFYRTYQIGNQSAVIAQHYRQGNLTLPLDFFGATYQANIYGIRFWQQTNHVGGSHGVQLNAEFDIKVGTNWVYDSDVSVGMDVFISGQSSPYATVNCSVKSFASPYWKYQCIYQSSAASLNIVSYRITMGAVDDISAVVQPMALYPTSSTGTAMVLQSSAYTFTDITDPNTAILNGIDDKIGNIIDTINDHNDAEQDAIDNISSQTPSDLNVGNDAQATNLIGVISGFLSYLSNITASSTCYVVLPFPSFAGGSWQVNLCQYKDKAGTIISVFSSLTLIVFFLPVCWKLLNMIYAEIRSFTNG